MGTWDIKISGHGSHHNKDYPQDADKLTRAFVDDLRAAGHEVSAATFMLAPPSGETEDVTAGAVTDADALAALEAKVPILKFFKYEHLPAHLQKVSKPFGDLARRMAASSPPGAELSAGLRKLLEAKDCLVRAALS